jgi:hypothetical protein
MNQHGALSTRLSTPAHPAVAVKQHPLKQPFRPDVAAFPKQLWAGTRPCPSSNLASSMNRRFQFQKRSQLSSARTVKRFAVVALDGFLEESALGPVVKDGALTRERSRITPQYFVANNSGQAARFSSMLV